MLRTVVYTVVCAQMASAALDTTTEGCLNVPSVACSTDTPVAFFVNNNNFGSVAVPVGGQSALGLVGIDLAGIPEYAQMGYAQAVPTLLRDEWVTLKCCGDTACDFFWSSYSCAGCSEGIDGNLPSVLAAAGWDAGSCAPTMDTGFTMKTFHRRLAAGSSVAVEVTATLAKSVIFGVPGGVTLPWCKPGQGPSLPVASCADSCYVPPPAPTEKRIGWDLETGTA